MDAQSREERADIVSDVVSNVAAATAAIVAGPAVGIAAAGAAPVMSASVRMAIGRWNGWRYRRVERTLTEASERLKMTADELVEALASDPASLDLLIETLDAAARTRVERKIGALGRVLVRTMASDGDGAAVERERVMVSIFRDLEVGHIAVLRFLSEDPERPGHLRLARRAAISRIEGAAPADHTLAVLGRHALVREVTADEISTWGDARQALAHAGISQAGRGPDQVAWMLTSLGTECLRELDDAAGESGLEDGSLPRHE